MVTRIGGFRRKTRHKLTRARREKGKLPLSAHLREFKEGERVVLKANSSIQKGMFNPRFFGKTGIISGKKGRCFEVSIVDIHKKKTVVVHPVHLKRL